jgi:DNA mismatch endonuclease (patch repair protein)
MDTVSKQKRSEIMSRVRSRDSKIEISFRKELWKRGFRYRKNSGKYFGKPDMVMPKYKTVIFVDSCFWHGCKKHCRLPAIRKVFWTKKIEGNKKRDKEVNKHYKKIGWRIIRIWEHDLKKKDYKFDFRQIKR